MNLLDEIIASKRKEIEVRRKQTSIDQLIKMPLFDKEKLSVSQAIKEGSGIIAEFKRCSPSAGKILDKDLETVLGFYNENKVSGYSVLTDEPYFGGSLMDLQKAAAIANGPVLRKDFIIDEYQLFEAKANGADAILLIAEVVDAYHAESLTTIAHSIGLEVLMEFHSAEEIEKINDSVDLIGVNNRDLKSLETRIETSEKLIKQLPFGALKITESGIHEVNQLKFLYDLGFEGALIGEGVLKNEALLSELTEAANHIKTVRYEN
ncbi:MAG: indole-3-glycerol phosphate synthase TrpC [Crocinitomicaceae bacterium]